MRLLINIFTKIELYLHRYNLMSQSGIYKVEVSYTQQFVDIKQSEPIVSYFSNLKKTIENIQNSLALNGWDAQRVNYTAVYRALNEKNKFICEFEANKVKYFKLIITKKILNPNLTMLGIDPKP